MSTHIPKIYYRRLRPFACSDKSEYVIELSFCNGKAQTGGKVFFAHRGNEVEIKREDFHSIFDISSGRGRARISRGYLSFNSYLRVFASFLAVKKSALLLHASGIICGNRAYVFFGKSGTGKTAIIKKSPYLQNLGDEITGVFNKKGRYYAFSTPFGGELGTPKENLCKHLDSLYMLNVSDRNTIETIPKGKAFNALLRCTINFSRDPRVISEISRIAAALLKSVIVCQKSRVKKKHIST